MLLNKYHISLRVQVTIWFTILFVGVAAATFSFVGHNLYTVLLRRLDQQLEEIARQCQKDYIIGTHARHLGVEIPISDLPEDLLCSFREKIPGFIPLIAFEPALTDKYSSPTVFGNAGSRIFLMRQNITGKVYSRQLKSDFNLHQVSRRLLLREKEQENTAFYFRFTRSDGKIVAVSKKFPPDILIPPPGQIISDRGLRTLYKDLPDGGTLLLAMPLQGIYTRFEHYLNDFLVIGLPVLFTGILLAWLISGRVAGGIRKVGDAASDIANGNYARRVKGNYHGQEIANLISAFNKMSDNTEKLLTELRGATDDVAHDLKTPLTRIRGLAEVTARGPRDFDLWSDALGNIAEECDDMVSIINTMLEITRTESRIEPFFQESVDLNKLLHKMHDLFSPAAEERQVQWELELPEKPINTPADRIKLQRLFGNLLDNALKFVPEKGKVQLKMHKSCDNQVLIQVIDNGPGIPDPDKPRVFERFVRLDASRSCRGNGLGLAMVRAITKAHGGTIFITDTPGGGATFNITLPATDS